MLPVKPTLAADQRELLDSYKQLSKADQGSVRAFAQFLNSRSTSESAETVFVLAEPVMIARPAKESVVAAMRRLSESYAMIDKALLLDQASSLMSSHILQGKSAKDVIDELETLFADTYQSMLEKQK